MCKLFGTDGIRGVVNEYPMTLEMIRRVGWALATIFKDNRERSKIIVGKDTRESGLMIQKALISGICSAGGDAYLSGTIPTPGVAIITFLENANAGIVITASHNPYCDNGIKIFKGDGYKLSKDEENNIETRVMDDTHAVRSHNDWETGTAITQNDPLKIYNSFLKSTLPSNFSLDGLKIVLDCANGATHQIAPELFSELGADVKLLGIRPNGKNINDKCGSENPVSLIRKVKENKADVGFAFDGDGDRLIAIDEGGSKIRGDRMLAIFAKTMKKNGDLNNNIVVSTIVSNLGLKNALEAIEIEYKESDVGDRNVMRKMLSTGAVLGGEDSGHIIFADHHTTGDGILAALKLIEAMQQEDKPLSELSKIVTLYPQKTENIEVRAQPNLETFPEIVKAIQSVESELEDQGKVIVRYSGTEPLCRIMVQAPGEGETQRYCKQLSEIINKKIGKY